MKLLDFAKGLKAPIYFTSIAPVLLGWAFSHFRYSYILVMLFVVTVTMQAALNLAMDYFDHQNSRPLRNEDTLFPLGSYFIEKLGVQPKYLKYSFFIMLVISIVTGLTVVYITRNLILLYLGLTAVFLSILYVVPPIKLGARGVGEIATFFSFGPFPVLGTILALGFHVSMESISVAIALGLLASGIRYLHHLPEDKQGGVRMRNFRIIYPVFLLASALIISPFRQLIIPALSVFTVSLVHVVFLPKGALDISRQTNIIVGIHALFTFLVIILLAL